MGNQKDPNMDESSVLQDKTDELKGRAKKSGKSFASKRIKDKAAGKFKSKSLDKFKSLKNSGVDKIVSGKNKVGNLGKQAFRSAGKKVANNGAAKAIGNKVAKSRATKAAKALAKKQFVRTAATGVRTAISSVVGGISGAALGWIILIVLLAIYIFGVILAFTFAPSAMMSTIKKYYNSTIDTVLRFLGYSNSQMEKRAETETIYSTADYIRKMGFNLYNDGFIYEKAKPSLNINEGDVPNPKENPKDFYLTDPAKLTKNDRYVEQEGIYVDPNNKTRYMENYLGTPLYFYAWANTHTYMINDREASYSNLRSKYSQNRQKSFAPEINRGDKDFFPGMIVPHYKEFREDNQSVWQNVKWWLDRGVDFVFTGNPKVNVNLDDYTMEIKAEGFNLKFNIQGWSGRYGFPINLLLALHRSTGSPDLVKTITYGNPKSGNEGGKDYDKVSYNIDILKVPSVVSYFYDFGSGEVNIKEELKNLQNKSKIKAEGYNPYTGALTEQNEDEDPATIEKRAVKTIVSKFEANGKKEKYKQDTQIVLADSVKNHWYRDVFFNMNGKNPGESEYVTYDVDYLIETGELWTKYNEDGTSQTSHQSGEWSVYEEPDGSRHTEQIPITKDMFSDGGTDEEIEAAFATLGNKTIKMNIETPDIGKQTQDARRGITNARTKKLFTDYVWYKYDGTEKKADEINKDRLRTNGALTKLFENNDPITSKLKSPIDIRNNFDDALALIKNSRDLDSEYAFRDFKELIVELGYYKREDLREGIRKVMLWPLKGVSPGKAWPAGYETRSVHTYGMDLFSTEFVKNLYLKQVKEDYDISIQNAQSRADRAKKEAVRLKTKEKQSEDRDIQKKVEDKVQEAVKKEKDLTDLKAKKEETLKKKKEEFDKKLQEALDNSTEENHSSKIRAALKSIDDSILKSIVRKYGEGYTEKDKVVAPVTGKVTYKTDDSGKPTVEIRALSKEDIDSGQLPPGYKEFYDSEYKGVIAGYTVKLLNVNKAEPEKEGESTSYKKQIPKYLIDKLSKDKKKDGKSDFDRIEEIEKAKTDAVPSAFVNGSLYVKEGTTIGVPAKMSEEKNPNIDLLNSDEDEAPVSSKTEKVNGDKITMILVNPDGEINERLIEYIVQPQNRGIHAELDDSLRGEEAIKMLVYWMNENYGLSSEAVAGILGNWDIESAGINPTAVEGIGGRDTTQEERDRARNADAKGIGLGQWSFDRHKALVAYADEHYNGEWWHYLPQLEFAFSVDSGKETMKKFAEGSGTDVTKNTDLFCYEWERPAAGNCVGRPKNAMKIYKIMQENDWLLDADPSKMAKIGEPVNGMPIGMEGVSEGSKN